jgi:hypothetical protein
VGGLEPVEADGQRVVRPRGPPGHDRAPAEPDGLGEPQPVALQDRESGEQVGFGRAVAQRQGDPQSLL